MGRVLTETSNEEGYEVPCSLSEQLEDVEKGCDSKQNHKNDCCRFRWIVMIKKVFLAVDSHLELILN